MPNPSRYYSSTAAKTTLSVQIDANASSIQLASTTGFPSSYPYTLILDKDTANEEIVEVTGLVGTAYSITRNIDGSGAKSHSVGATVEHGVSARDFAESRSHEIATNAHGVTGDIVGTGGAQAITGVKTFTTPVINGGTINTPTIAGATISGTFTSTATINGGSIVGATITGLSSVGVVSSSAAPVSYVDSILGSATSAGISASSAAASATAAATSASSAATSASSAAASATTASNSAATAVSSAATATTQALAAATSATSAAASATAAATSATSAAASATAAATSATSAAASATTAAASVATIATYAANALASQNAAATSENNASNYSNTAGAFASSAAASSIAAATSAASAATSASSAATSATNAQAYELSANNWATLTTGPVAGGEYSAKYHAINAATSASSASASATAAASSATSAEAAWDSFDDRYLGPKASPPATDNDGNALTAGVIYYNTGDGQMYAYSGSAWIVFTSTGDITAVTASSPLTGGGTSGEVTIGIQDASTSQKGAVQLTDSVTSTSVTTAAVPNSVKAAYDAAIAASSAASSAQATANAAIAQSLVDAKGDIITATADNTPARLAVGSDGQYLRADSTSATGLTWATVDALPSQTGNAGKYLTTNGTSASWGTISVSSDPTPTVFLLMGA